MEGINFDVLGTTELKRFMAAAQKELFVRRLRAVEMSMGAFQVDYPRAANLLILQEHLSLLKRKSRNPSFNAVDESAVSMLEDLEFWMEVDN